MDTFCVELNIYLQHNIPKYNIEIKNDKYNYETFGKTFELFLINDLHSNFSHTKISDFAKNKNEYPDIKIPEYDMAIDIKCGNSFVKCKNLFQPSCNSHNDYGTISSWLTTKLRSFKHHYIIFIQYTINDNDKYINNIYFNPVYYYVGRRNDTLSYREKDGNLRPKSFQHFHQPCCNDIDEFETLLVKTNIVRNKTIALKKIKAVVSVISDVNTKLDFQDEINKLFVSK
jgi:hypothetical protein